jgi:hypothetical protein
VDTPSSVDDAVAALVDGLTARLHAGGFVAQAAAAATLTPAAPTPPRTALPVLRHLRTALDLAPPGALVDALAVVSERASWTRTASYLRDPPGPSFLDGYAHITIAGPPDGMGGGAVAGDASGRAALGALLLGPRVDYPRHQHPADEVYLPLTGAWWVHDVDDDLVHVPAGTLIHHVPGQPHGMRTGRTPLLALYLWTGDVTTPSRFGADPEFA